MPDEPSPQLFDLLALLQLAKPQQVRGMKRRAKRLARGGALLDVVWVDALVQARMLTPYQGSEVNAGRGEQLIVGSYLLQRLTARLGYADSFIAVDRESKRTVQLVVRRSPVGQTILPTEKNQSIEDTSGVFNPLADRNACPTKAIATGCDDKTAWAAYVSADGMCVAQWLACQGRFTPNAALEIARQLAAALAALESAGIVHGDISASAVRIDANGSVQLTRAGFRDSIRPDETIDAESLPVEAFDYLAPERILRRSPPSISADVFSLGCLLWHLLTGRTPRGGGSRAAKLAAIRSARIPDVHRIAPEASAPLLATIARCLNIDEAQRPQSFVEIAKAVGPPTSAGRRLLVEIIARSRRSTIRPGWQWHVRTKVQRSATQLAATAACIALLATATWPLWRSRPLPVERFAAVQSAAVRPAIALADSNPVVSQPKVQLTNYQVAKPQQTVLELPGDVEVPGGSLRLENGVIVRGRNAQRVRILAPPNGIVVSAEDVRFENVDFIWRHRPERITSPDQNAIVEQRARNTEFVGCTFQAADAPPFGLPPAVRLQTGGGRATTLPPACRVRFERCTIANVATAVVAASAGPMAIEIHETLHVAQGPLIQLPELPAIDTPVSIQLQQVTVRGANSVVELAGGRSNHVASGAISIEAIGCAFALESTGALFRFTGLHLPKAAVGGRIPINWTGQGSLSEIDTIVAIWQHDGTSETLPNDLLSVEGLVTGKMEFFGSADSDPGSSLLFNGLAPLLNDEPPGIGNSLPQVPPLKLPTGAN